MPRQRELGHQMAHGGIVLDDNDSDACVLAGAWLGTCFHESGVTSGALAARQALECVLPAGPQRLALAHSIPVWRPTPPTAGAALPAWFYRARTSHTSKVGAGYQFAYNMPEVCAVDLQHPPVYWWGGFSRADHWGAPTTPLLHAVVETVQHQIGFYCVGPVDCITTLRAFGQVNNPVSVYLLWRDELRTQLDAVALEVTNYPWGERTLYAVDARRATMPKSCRTTTTTNDDESAARCACAVAFAKRCTCRRFTSIRRWSITGTTARSTLCRRRRRPTNTAAPFRRFTMRLRCATVARRGQSAARRAVGAERARVSQRAAGAGGAADVDAHSAPGGGAAERRRSQAVCARLAAVRAALGRVHDGDCVVRGHDARRRRARRRGAARGDCGAARAPATTLRFGDSAAIARLNVGRNDHSDRLLAFL
jgi:hypothetical protein